MIEQEEKLIIIGGRKKKRVWTLELNIISLLYSTALVPNAGTDNAYLICVFIRFISCLLGKVKYCISIRLSVDP